MSKKSGYTNKMKWENSTVQLINGLVKAAGMHCILIMILWLLKKQLDKGEGRGTLKGLSNKIYKQERNNKGFTVQAERKWTKNLMDVDRAQELGRIGCGSTGRGLGDGRGKDGWWEF